MLSISLRRLARPNPGGLLATPPNTCRRSSLASLYQQLSQHVTPAPTEDDGGEAERLAAKRLAEFNIRPGGRPKKPPPEVPPPKKVGRRPGPRPKALDIKDL